MLVRRGVEHDDTLGAATDDSDVVDRHGPYESTSRWRVVIKETTKLLDLSLEGEELPDPDVSYRESVSALEQLGDD